MLELMGNISELVYVADLETYELLYVNESGKKRFNLSDNFDGLKCYEAFQDAHEPCSFCTNALLTKNENYTWEKTNPLTGKHYMLKDRLIDWDGRLARLEVAFDITASEDEKQSLRNALEAEHILLRCIKQLHNSEGISTGIENVLREIGIVLAAERTLLYSFSGNSLEATSEWCAPTASQQTDGETFFDLGALNRWRDTFLGSDCIVIDDIERIKSNLPDEYRTLEAQGIRGIVIAPLTRDGELIGVLIAVNPSASHIATASTLLATLQYFLASALCRLEDERRLKALGFRDALTGLFNRNRYIEDSARLAQIEESLGALYLDLNGLKEINDCRGHAQGNAALMYCAEVLESVFPDAVLYRVGGDEFVVLSESSERSDFFERVERLRTYFSDTSPYSAAVGAQWTDGSERIESLVLSADASMYEDKRRYYRTHDLSGRYRDFSENDGVAPEAAQHKEYEMLMDSMQVSISKHLLREDLFMIWANDRFYEMIGYSRKEFFELCGGHIDKYFGDDLREYDRLSQVILSAYEAGKKSYESIMYIPQKDGSYIWISLVGTFTDEVIDGAPVIFTVFTDVTNFVQAEKEKGIAFDVLPGFIAKFQVTPDRPHLLASSERFATFFGSTESGTTSKALLDCLDANWPTIKQHYRKLRAGDPISFEVDAEGADGRYARFQITANCVNIFEGDPIYLVVFLDISELREKQAELETVAYVDPVTQGPNRLRFSIDAEQAIQCAPPNTYILASLDIHRFKVINDLFGITAGDRTLAHVFQVLESHLMEGEYAARFASDIFSILFKADEDEVLLARIEAIAQDINTVNFELEHKFLLTIMVGLYPVAEPDLPLIQIHDRANVARNRLKGNPKAQLALCRFYDNSDRVQLTRESELENYMQTALENREFMVYFQPKYNLTGDSIVGAEALVRWQHPLYGFMQPDSFIPLFEKNGFIVELDRYVFECVCMILKRWIDEGKDPVPVSVNVSRMHFTLLNFLDYYEEIRSRNGVPADLLEFEVTETLILESPELFGNIVNEIRQRGYHCSMDDFGSGYSSLNVLKGINVDILKLDKAFFSSEFMSDERERCIVSSVIELAKTLGMETVAEGIETNEQAEFLRKTDCNMIQGYLYSRPVPIEDFEDLAFGKGLSV